LRRSLPLRGWEDDDAGGAAKDPDAFLTRRAATPFFFKASDRARYTPQLARWPGESAKRADEIASGVFPYFSHAAMRVDFPPDWHANPFSGQRAPSNRHWSKIGDFECGDIKVIWEPSRFAFAFTLVRAYWRTGEERHAETFWRLVEDWREMNPPQAGVNWKCGQEIAFRVMAWCFGLHGFLDAAATTPSRVAQLGQMIAVSGARIAANIDYALNQQNNHGISEAVGLWTIGALFPEFSSAAAWKRRGHELLERLGRELIYEDGAFSQHSTNYHRVMLHDYVWALRLGELHGAPFSEELKGRVARAGEFLFQMQDEASGRVPNSGHNDGALVLPLSDCAYPDFRPAVQAAHFLATGERLLAPGPWDEDLLWLFGPDAPAAPLRTREREDLSAADGGLFAFRAAESFAVTRCPVFRHRPSHADALHVDLWWRGENIALDAGSYSYNAAPPWDGALARAAAHNTVTVDGHDQMEQVGKFLWLPWLRATAGARRRSGRLAYCEAAHDGYARLAGPASHRRGIVRLGADFWLVLDALRSGLPHDHRLHWLLLDAPHDWDSDSGRLTLDTRAGRYFAQADTFSRNGRRSLVRGGEDSVRGWRSLFYQHREPALSLEVLARGANADFWTVFGPSSFVVGIAQDALTLTSDAMKARVELTAAPDGPLVSAVEVRAEFSERMEVA
jgi:asparagine synthase (glutamine-hydrolysing)